MGGGAVEKMMGDDRFKSLFTDKEFEIDTNTDAYKFTKSGNVKKKLKEEDVDSVISENDEPVTKGRDLNKLFAGKGNDLSSESQGSDSDDD